MNYTENYHLPQWEENDQLRMDDFNKMSRDIESGIVSTTHALEVLIGKAQGSANAAQSAAEAARETALTYRHFVIGEYSGTNIPQKITLGFRPAALLVCRAGTTPQCFVPGKQTSYLTIVEDGFELPQYKDGLSIPNNGLFSYVYVAFR